mmetsp:Transcript_23448/g.70021  ORF Transcript_23448/g.70021 Transcript_23448/m.70021 type:complete len:300 (-) Transcript_23448:15-914(-)
MPVVPALANREDGDELVLRGVALRVVRPPAPQVRARVDHPRAVQHPHVPQAARHEEAVPEGLAPRELRHKPRDEEAPHKVPPRVVAVLEHDGPVRLQVVHIDLAPRLRHARVLFEVQPPHVRKPKPADRVVRVGHRLRVEVVRAVVARPVENGALVGARVDQHHDEAVGEGRLVAAVRPQPVRAAGDAKAGDWPEDEGPPDGGDLAVGHEEDARKAKQLRQCDVRGHREADVLQRRRERGAFALLVLVRDGGLCQGVERALLGVGARERAAVGGEDHLAAGVVWGIVASDAGVAFGEPS